MSKPEGGQPPQPESSEPLFALGRLLATPGAIAECTRAGVTPLDYIARHAAGDWGDLNPEDWRENIRALEYGSRIFTAYTLPTDERLWVITEADRSATTALLPSEY